MSASTDNQPELHHVRAEASSVGYARGGAVAADLVLILSCLELGTPWLQFGA